VNIRKTLLNDPEYGGLHLGKKRGAFPGISRVTSMPLRFEKPSTYQERAEVQAQFIQQGWVQQVRKSSNFRSATFDEVDRVIQTSSKGMKNCRSIPS